MYKLPNNHRSLEVTNSLSFNQGLLIETQQVFSSLPLCLIKESGYMPTGWLITLSLQNRAFKIPVHAHPQHSRAPPST